MLLTVFVGLFIFYLIISIDLEQRTCEIFLEINMVFIINNAYIWRNLNTTETHVYCLFNSTDIRVLSLYEEQYRYTNTVSLRGTPQRHTCTVSLREHYRDTCVLSL